MMHDWCLVVISVVFSHLVKFCLFILGITHAVLLLKYYTKKLISNITNKLRKLFCRYGAPVTLVTDKGPQVTHIAKFDVFMKEFGVNHKKVTPYHPEANVEVETHPSSYYCWSKLANSFIKLLLLSYQTTPHVMAELAPAKMPSGFDIQDKLPSKILPIHKSDQTNTSKAVKMCDDMSKAIIKQYT